MHEKHVMHVHTKDDEFAPMGYSQSQMQVTEWLNAALVLFQPFRYENKFIYTRVSHKCKFVSNIFGHNNVTDSDAYKGSELSVEKDLCGSDKFPTVLKAIKPDSNWSFYETLCAEKLKQFFKRTQSHPVVFSSTK